MNIFEKIWNSIVSSNDDQYIDQINELKRQSEIDKNTIKNQEDNLNTISSQYDSIISENEGLLEEIAILEERIEDLESEPIDVENHDIVMNSNDYPYLPNWKVYYWDNDKVTTKDVKFTPTKFYRIWSDEMYKFFNNAIKDCKTFDEKVVKLRDVIRRRVVYERDVSSKGNPSENWRLPPETFYGQIGDCEDITILWIAACKICGLPADRVFNATGYVKVFKKEAGHSWGIAKFDDGKWYVVDSTSNRVVKLLGSDYKIKGFIRGISNWKFSGVPADEQF